MAEPLPPTPDPFASLPDEIMTSILDLLDKWQDMASLASTSKPNQRLIFNTVDVMLLALLEKLSNDKITVSANNMSPNQMGLAGFFSFHIEKGNIHIPDEKTQQNIEMNMEQYEYLLYLGPEYAPSQDEVYINIGKNVRALHKYLLAKIPRLNATQMMGVTPENHAHKADIMRIIKLISYESGFHPNAQFDYATDLQAGGNTSRVKYQDRVYKLKRDTQGKYIIKERHKLYLKSIKGKFRYVR